MISLQEWKELNEDIQDNIEGAQATPPMEIVQKVMSQIAPIIINAHQEIEAWPVEKDKVAARRTLDAQLLKASRDQWLGKARMAANQMNHGMDAQKALKRFGGLNRNAANQIVGNI